jgi:hypothetical protein
MVVRIDIEDDASMFPSALRMCPSNESKISSDLRVFAFNHSKVSLDLVLVRTDPSKFQPGEEKALSNQPLSKEYEPLCLRGEELVATKAPLLQRSLSRWILRFLRRRRACVTAFLTTRRSRCAERRVPLGKSHAWERECGTAPTARDTRFAAGDIWIGQRRASLSACGVRFAERGIDVPLRDTWFAARDTWIGQ